MPPFEYESEKGKSGYLILARHGDTFEPGQRVVWVGSRNDLPLAANGIKQARELGEACRDSGITFDTVLSGPLKRTRDYARIVKEALINKSDTVASQSWQNELHDEVIDQRLNEIDYGSWSGLSDQEVIERFGEDQLKAWHQLGIWPENADWGGTADSILGEITEFCASLMPTLAAGKNVLAVTSNGRLKFFLAMVPDALANARRQGALKVKTGNVCVFSLKQEAQARAPEPECKYEYKCLAWNSAPKIALSAKSLISTF